MPKKESDDFLGIHELSPPTYIVEEDEKGNLINKFLKVTFPTRPSKGRYSLGHYLRNRSKALRCSLSPPTYRVEEDENGNLVNKELKVVYPEYPRKGRFSLSNYLKNKKASRGHSREKKAKESRKQTSKSRQEDCDFDEKSVKSVKSEKFENALGDAKCRNYKKCRCTCGKCCCKLVNRWRNDRSCRHKPNENSLAIPQKNQEKSLREDRSSESISTIRANNSSARLDNSVTQFRNSMPIPENLTGIFAGARMSHEVELMLMPTQFLLYYLRPTSIQSIDDVPLSEPLTIAYRASDYNVAHYRVKYLSTKSGEKMWSVDMGDSNQPSFFSLDKLIQYYKVFAISLEDGCVEFFQSK